MADEVSDGGPDLTFSAMSLYKSQAERLIASWMPADFQAPDTGVQETFNDDGPIQPINEVAGMGSKAQHNDESDFVDSLLRRTSTSNEKLLVTLLGKKAAENRMKKSQQDMPSQSNKYELDKQATKFVVAREESDEEDGSGRASAFSSRKGDVRAAKASGGSPLDAVEDELEDEDGSPGAVTKQRITNREEQSAEHLTTKRKATGSFLDEMLAKKSKRKKKKNKAGGVT